MIKLEEICGYLPYKVSVMMLVENDSYEPIIEILQGLEYGYQSGEPLALIGEFGEVDLSIIKPILRPLSDLTKEIEYNGEKFVPIKVIEKEFLMEGLLLFKETEYGWTGFTDGKDCNIPIYMCNEIMPECGYGIIKKLYKWHFDIHRLIERNDAIDINTLKP